jgi:hypothetical protein
VSNLGEKFPEITRKFGKTGWTNREIHQEFGALSGSVQQSQEKTSPGVLDRDCHLRWKRFRRFGKIILGIPEKAGIWRVTDVRLRLLVFASIMLLGWECSREPWSTWGNQKRRHVRVASFTMIFDLSIFTVTSFVDGPWKQINRSNFNNGIQ